MTTVVDDRAVGRMPWPTTALAAAERAFQLLACEPRPLALDCRGLPHLPQREVPLGKLRDLMVCDETSPQARDAVWRRLVPLARSGDPEWRVAVVGMALPGLRRMAGLLARGWHGDSCDRDSEMISGFLDRLADLDLSHDRIAGKLVDAGARAVKDAMQREASAPTIAVHATWSLPPRPPADHPEWVLVRAVAAGVLSPEDWYLISRTRLEDETVQAVAGRLGVSAAVAGAWRRQAEQKLVTAIAGGELDRVSIIEAAARTTRMRARRRRLALRAIGATRARSTAGAPAAA
ncbi:hypothetical protein [Rugosimonospora africana]|uniref:Uncharacterized protein n=1 Tax=Rugosimonospora africana TaxID=556532 RepID=A0A8J3QUB2_9ACTN|nr:hypothetical protein [Rugosimonospora africana]GIH16147.1 hypothetical protein Raf01_43190 [Rugosimonospora africana]